MGLMHLLGLSKHKIGLALGSGSIKGFAHIGVLKVLKDNNIPISFMSGTSAGSLVGGLYLANGQSIEKLEKIVDEIGTKEILNLFADFSLNGGLVSGNKITKFLNDLFGNINIEDLPIPFVTVATDLTTGYAKVFKKGNLAEAVRASISIPLVFKPIKIGDNYYIDGGVIYPVPISQLKQMGADKVIACRLNNQLLPIDAIKNDRVIVNPIERSLSLMMRDIEDKECQLADVTISPNFKSLTDPSNITNYNKRKEIISLGEIATLKHIEKIRKLV
jgi:NTE family protein